MTKEIALDMLYEGDLYDAFGYVSADGYAALAALDGVVLQERKTGKWEVYTDGFANILRCTAEGCGASVNITEACHLQYYKKNFRYCPFCGAKMEVADDN